MHLVTKAFNSAIDNSNYEIEDAKRKWFEQILRLIALTHDLGHAPFGHGGEKILTNILKRYNMDKFWHERNSLHFVDCIELLEDDNHNYHNLNLTYAIRDGIISHCGEMHQKYIQKRKED